LEGLVIASEAKQSRATDAEPIEIASSAFGLLAMTRRVSHTASLRAKRSNPAPRMLN
jgi:hypothetical protein